MKSRRSTEWTWHTAQKGHLLNPRKGLEMAGLTAWKDKRDPHGLTGHFTQWISCMDIVIAMKETEETFVPLPLAIKQIKWWFPRNCSFPRNPMLEETKQNCWSHQLEKERDFTQPSHRMRPLPQERLEQRQRSMMDRTTLDHYCWVTHTQGSTKMDFG